MTLRFVEPPRHNEKRRRVLDHILHEMTTRGLDMGLATGTLAEEFEMPRKWMYRALCSLWSLGKVVRWREPYIAATIGVARNSWFWATTESLKRGRANGKH